MLKSTPSLPPVVLPYCSVKLSLPYTHPVGTQKLLGTWLVIQFCSQLAAVSLLSAFQQCKKELWAAWLGFREVSTGSEVWELFYDKLVVLKFFSPEHSLLSLQSERELPQWDRLLFPLG